MSSATTTKEQKAFTQWTLPASWYHSTQLYEAERRAIFSQKWLQITHANRFTDPGDFASYEMAGYPFFIIKGRSGELRAFHNVCRHRAFPVVKGKSGKGKKILSCGYHGWSYGLNGKLAKAPRFQNLPDFNAENYSLFPIHLHIDRCGFVWVNLDAQDVPSVSWDEQCGAVDAQERLGVFEMEKYSYHHSWEFEAEYNWKTMVDNYNECYHCPVAHPGIAATTDLKNYSVATEQGFIAHFARPKPEYAADNNSNVAPTYVFPSSAITINSVYLYLTRCVPLGATSVRMEYEIYRHAGCADEEFAAMDAFMKQIEEEDRVLCSLVQANLNVGVYRSGPLHPREEMGVAYVKGLVKRAVMAHVQREKEAGVEIWPAAVGREDGAPNPEAEEEEAFCKTLCNGGSLEELSW
ncbi:Rieske domain-containing protein [Histoplasma capsulatum G186AR]|nr:Rieske domain-containing protein [Histoplasma capsulatum]QSS76425.1 Rieske domain-containing protein [Histoplasma capsulatum G186AR]